MSELIKEIENGRILKKNGSWMYCSKCDKTIGYLCYSTYQDFKFEFNCNCGNKGHFLLKYETKKPVTKSKQKLIIIKNRFCCPNDDSPLFSVVDKNIEKYSYIITCKKCLTEYINR